MLENGVGNRRDNENGVGNHRDNENGVGNDTNNENSVYRNAATGATLDDERDEVILNRSLVPGPLSRGDRTVSTEVRLRRQGFTASKSSNFAVRSIRRGSDDWNAVIKPFVSDLAFRSILCQRFQSVMTFRPYTCHAAVLFVDLSGYSKITAAIADRGAHFLSNVVNAYLSRLLQIIHSYGGDVVKFAGDAVLVVWEGKEEDLEINLLCAAKCAVEIQAKASSHPVEGTSLEFKIHCGLCIGPLESEVFEAPTHINMQRLYHSVGGESLEEISELVDLAKSGEICISESCAQYLGSRGRYETVEGTSIPCRLLTDVTSKAAELELHIEQVMADRLTRRNKQIEEEFIHPSVLRLLSHGGLSPTQIAQMRELCVLFIAMTSSGSSVNWLMEVQSVLDKNRCPIVQIIDDDKGVHVVAAVNLYESVPETSHWGLQVCRDLVEIEVGCAIGMAMGSTFCGVTGSRAVACRWDITGPPAVRAARLMQYALVEGLAIAIDQSVYDKTPYSTFLCVQNDSVLVKGAPAPVTVYSLSDAKSCAAYKVLESVHGTVHDGAVKEIQRHIKNPRSRVAVVVTGIPLAGKKIVCQRAAGYSDLVPYLHICDESFGLLQLARTIATWFRYAEKENVRVIADSVMEHLGKGHWTRAHDECVRLVNASIEEGVRSCFLVDRIQSLDKFSLSLMRECLYWRPKSQRGRSSRLSEPSSSMSTSTLQDSQSDLSIGVDMGKICFLCVHVPMYNSSSAQFVVEDITRAHRTYRIPIVEVGEASREELGALTRSLSDTEAEERWVYASSEASGYCAGMYVERTAAVIGLSGKRWSEGKPAIVETSADASLHIPPGQLRNFRLHPVTQVGTEVAMRFSKIYDELPPLLQTIVKVLTVATRTRIAKLPRFIMWEVLNDLINEGVDSDVFGTVLGELKDMFLLKFERQYDMEVLSFQTPALGDIALDVCTPRQIKSIANALIDRLEPYLLRSFEVPLVMADLHLQTGRKDDVVKRLWVQGYQALLLESRGWTKCSVDYWKEIVEDEIVAAGFSAKEILGPDFCSNCQGKETISSKQLVLMKMYRGPITFGPMGEYISLICYSIFKEYCALRGGNPDDHAVLLRDLKSGCEQYLKYAAVLDEFMKENGYETNPEFQRQERDLLALISSPAKNEKDVFKKVKVFREDFVSLVIEPRRQRLISLVSKLRGGGLPAIVARTDIRIRRAYEAMQVAKNREDSAHDALMILATTNWKRKPMPEYLPHLKHQTVARIRNVVLKRLSKGELYTQKHQQTIEDLEAFLVVTSLLQESEATGLC